MNSADFAKIDWGTGKQAIRTLLVFKDGECKEKAVERAVLSRPEGGRWSCGAPSEGVVYGSLKALSSSIKFQFGGNGQY